MDKKWIFCVWCINAVKYYKKSPDYSLYIELMQQTLCGKNMLDPQPNDGNGKTAFNTEQIM